MNDVSHPPLETEQRLARDLRAVVDDAEALLRHTVSDAGQGYADARSRLEQSLRSARERLAGLQGEIVDRARAAGRATDQYVHEHPWQSIGIGAGIGLFVGVLLARR